MVINIAGCDLIKSLTECDILNGVLSRVQHLDLSQYDLESSEGERELDTIIQREIQIFLETCYFVSIAHRAIHRFDKDSDSESSSESESDSSSESSSLS